MNLNSEIPKESSLALILLQGASWTHFCHPDLSQLRTSARFTACFNWQLWVPGAFDRWELIQAQELHGKLRIKGNVQQLNSDIGNITAWLEKTEAELEALRLAEPPSDIQEIALRVKRLQVSGSRGGGGRKLEQAELGLWC